jgi:hypothetical protein
MLPASPGPGDRTSFRWTDGRGRTDPRMDERKDGRTGQPRVSRRLRQGSATRRTSAAPGQRHETYGSSEGRLIAVL